MELDNDAVIVTAASITAAVSMQSVIIGIFGVWGDFFMIYHSSLPGCFCAISFAISIIAVIFRISSGVGIFK